LIVNWHHIVTVAHARKISVKFGIEEGQTMQWLKEKGKRTNNDLQIITQKTKDRATRTQLKKTQVSRKD
jgi:hypothetical protein